jgi:hypothetical protein
LQYYLLGCVFALPLLQGIFPHTPVFQPIVKVWSGASHRGEPIAASGSERFFSLTSTPKVFSIPYFQPTWRLAWLGLALVSLLLLSRDLWSLRQIRRKAFLIRRIGRVEIFLSETIGIPFSYWIPFQARVLIPENLLRRHKDYRMVVSHELQHHRQRDTQWVFLIWALRALCFWNPFIHLWSRWLSEIQEFACDEALVDQHKVESRQYARCLIETVENATRPKGNPMCAMGLSFRTDRLNLKRRIERMLTTTRTKTTRSPSPLGWAFAFAAGMAAVAMASRGIVQDRRVSLADAQKLISMNPSDSDFPLEVNDLVLAELNRYIGTPDGREWLRDSLRRMEDHRAVIEPKLKQYGVPSDLMAVPVVESGYQNLPDKNKLGHGAGLWMFIRGTARAYGMQVSDKIDERLNIPMETDAAMRYLKADRIRYNDWRLSLLAYNWGEGALDDAIRKANSRDPWTLVRTGFENDKGYLAKVMATALILRNPETVK